MAGHHVYNSSGFAFFLLSTTTAIILGELGLPFFEFCTAVRNSQAYLIVKFVKLCQGNVLDVYVLWDITAASHPCP